MKKGVKKAAVLGLSASLALSSLAGCSKKETFDTEATALTVNDASLSAGVVNFAVRYSQANYESLYMSLGLEDPFSQDLYGNGTTLGDDLKTQITTQLTHALLAEQKMGDYDVSLSDDEKKQIEDAAAAFVAANDAEVLEEIGVTEESVARYLELTVIQDRVEDGMSADVDTEVSDEEAAQRKIQYVLFAPETETEAETEEGTEAETDTEDESAAETEEETAAETEAETAEETESESAALTENETTKTQSSAETETEALAETEEETAAETEEETTADTEDASEAEETEAETETETETETEDPETAAANARAYAHAEELIAKLQDGEDFETAAEDMGKTANTTTFGSDYSIEELVEATDGVEDGTLIETPIETSNGCYVVKLVSQLDREATDSKKETIVNQRKQERISELYEEWEEAGDVSTDAEVLASITFDYHLAQPAETETEAAESETEAAGTEAAESEAAESETETAGTEAMTEAESAEGETEAAETETEAAESETAE